MLLDGIVCINQLQSTVSRGFDIREKDPPASHPVFSRRSGCVDQQWIAAFRMKNFNDDAAILRSGSGNQLPHLIYLVETAKDFFQSFAGLPRRRTARATEFEYDPRFVLRLHLLLLLTPRTPLRVLLVVQRATTYPA